MSAHQSENLALTEKNMAFARAVFLDTNSKKSQADHYKEVFGSGAKGHSLICMASRLWNAPAIKEYVDGLRAELRERYMVTVESLIQELDDIKEVALGAATPQCGPAVSAVMGKAKLAGLDKQVIEHVGANGGPILTKDVSDYTDAELAALIANDNEG